MLILKRISVVLVVLCLVLSGSLTTNASAQAVSGEMTRADLFDLYGFEYISYSYTPGGISDKSVRTSRFAYSDAMLLEDANVLSTDMAKASLALSFTAYQKKFVDALLVDLGFQAYDNTAAYEATENLTIDDNDHVAYTIARKTIEHDGETYMAYCIPVKGTSSNGEWFSNFNLGESSSVHLGFMNSANKVYDAMRQAFALDGVDADHRIIWISGHSRGAACVNIIAGWLASGEFAKTEHTFAYTYACPSVSKVADESLTNIYNFNNIGDVVTMLPLTRDGWDYKRHGQTIILDVDQIDNFKNRFYDVAKESYVGQETNVNYEELLGGWMPSRDDYFKLNNQLIIQVVAYAMGGKADCTLEELIDHLGSMVSDDIAKKLSECSSIVDVMDLTVSMEGAYSSWVDLADRCYQDTKDMTQEEFSAYLETNSSQIQQLEDISQVSITENALFLVAKEACQDLMDEAQGIKKAADLVTQLFIDSNGDPLAAVTQAHDHTTYITWINSMYYGHQGWKGNSQLTQVHITADYSEIGESCFESCGALTDVIIDDGVYHLGDRSLSSCSGLRSVTMPVDIQYAFSIDHPFAATSNVTSIRYTYGRTGVMQDRTASSSDHYHRYSLEYVSRAALKTVSFDEGITHIGSYAYYPQYDMNYGSIYESVLETVELPTTLQTIGESAFRKCSALMNIQLPEGLTSIGAYGFYGCSALEEITFPSALSQISAHCFEECDAMDTLVIPDTITSLGERAFASMDALRNVMMPVD
ncbi:MAG: leucine-rich repeat protein, partial [Oscillospiraceae bacterium]|nr:leucine-rich repeat protein [Oscillospiraceae bacterium]